VIVFPTTLVSIDVGLDGLILRFDHGGRYPPPMQGLGDGEGWVTPDDVRRWAQALCAAAGVLRPGHIRNRPVHLIVDEGIIGTIVFTDTKLLLRFLDVCYR
jgi:hypothetical protein